MYTAFAQVYDALMEVDYAAWAQYYHELMKKAGVKEKGKCVECACGTGGLTLPLRKLGWQMTGVDLSEEMLARAMEKARAAGMIIPFVCQDMCALSVPTRVHCVLCTCDGVNYLTAPEKVQQLPTETDAAARVKQLMEGGMSRKDAVKQTAKELNLPKNAVYDAALNME